MRGEISLPEVAAFFFGENFGRSHLGAAAFARSPDIVYLEEKVLIHITPKKSNLCRVLDQDSFLVMGIRG